LGSYFIVEDTTEISYAARIVQGDWHSLLTNFTGNYLQSPIMRVYRPCLLLSLIGDYAIWHANPFGYFLTGIVALIACAVMLYLLLRELSKTWPARTSSLFALLSACLFASSPLHCESISYICGRDNMISSFFYLLSLWCFVRKRLSKSPILTGAGIASFWIAMLSKEISIGLPVTLVSIAFLFPDLFTARANLPVPRIRSLAERICLSVRVSLALWINTVIYMVIRFLALGTLTGGYTGGMGSALMSTVIKRWTDLDTVARIFFPLNLAIFGHTSSYRTILTALYLVLFTLALLGLASRVRTIANHLRWLAFLTLWMFTAIAPLYQLWGLGENLQGVRMYFFMSIPLSVLITFLVLAPASGTGETSKHRGEHSAVQIPAVLSVVALVLLIIVNSNITFHNNIPWVHAGRQARACRAACEQLGKSLAPGQKAALLGLPYEENGAGIIYNSANFDSMMSPPFSDANYTDKFVLFEPVFFGHAQYINMQQLKRALCDSAVIGTYAWNENNLKFEPVSTPSREILIGSESVAPFEFKEESGLPLTLPSTLGAFDNHGRVISPGDYGHLVAPSKAVNPFRYDFLEFTMTAAQAVEPLSVFWKGSKDSNWHDLSYPKYALACTSPTNKQARIRLSDCWRWFAQGDVTGLKVSFAPDEHVALRNVRLVSAKTVMPSVSITNVQPDNNGVYLIGGSGLKFSCDASSVHNCASIQIEVSKPNYFYEGPEGALPEATMKIFPKLSPGSELTIACSEFPEEGYYQLCARCLDYKDVPIGERSDPVTIQRVK
jgi:hypothetical protein